MSRETQGPILLAIAAVLSLSAMISYQIGDFQERTLRREAILRERNAWRDQDARMTEHRAGMNSRDERDLRDRAELRGQINTIMHTLQRIEKAVQTTSR